MRQIFAQSKRLSDGNSTGVKALETAQESIAVRLVHAQSKEMYYCASTKAARLHNIN
jgi:hypothetical protein